jgi:hypothetical protein
LFCSPDEVRFGYCESSPLSSSDSCTSSTISTMTMYHFWVFATISPLSSALFVLRSVLARSAADLYTLAHFHPSRIVIGNLREHQFGPYQGTSILKTVRSHSLRNSENSNGTFIVISSSSPLIISLDLTQMSRCESPRGLMSSAGRST